MATATGSDYKVKITSIDQSTLFDLSNSSFAIFTVSGHSRLRQMVERAGRLALHRILPGLIILLENVTDRSI